MHSQALNSRHPPVLKAISCQSAKVVLGQQCDGMQKAAVRRACHLSSEMGLEILVFCRLWRRSRPSMRPVSGQITLKGPWGAPQLPRDPPPLLQTTEFPRLFDRQPCSTKKTQAQRC